MSPPATPRDLSEYDQIKLELADIVRFAAVKSPHVGGILPREYVAFFEHLADDRFNLAFVGRFNRGKTSLMNALLGSDRLPTGLVPLTSVITTVSYGSAERVDLEFERGGLSPEIPMRDLAEYITEYGNPGNRRGIREARIRLPAEALRRGYYFVDTPGLGSAIVENTRTSLGFLPESDALVLVSSYESPLSEEEVRVLEEMSRAHTQVFFVLNKHDCIERESRQEVLAFVERRLQSMLGSSRPAIFSTSAKLALAAKLEGDRERLEMTGLPALEHALTSFLLEHKSREFLRRMLARASAILESFPEDEAISALKARLGRVNVADEPVMESPRSLTVRAPPRYFAAEPVGHCELCERINDQLFRFLCTFQHAVVTDAQVLGRFVAARGFCSRHLWLYAALAASRDVCVALSPLLEEFSRQLRDTNPEGDPSPRLPACQMCEIQQHLESETIARIASQIPRADLTLSHAPSLCVPHLRLATERLHDSGLATALHETHARSFERLAEDMRHYALKRDALRRNLTSEEERQAAENAVHRLAGRRLINP